MKCSPNPRLEDETLAMCNKDKSSHVILSSYTEGKNGIKQNLIPHLVDILLGLVNFKAGQVTQIHLVPLQALSKSRAPHCLFSMTCLSLYYLNSAQCLTWAQMSCSSISCDVFSSKLCFLSIFFFFSNWHLQVNLNEYFWKSLFPNAVVDFKIVF